MSDPISPLTDDTAAERAAVKSHEKHKSPPMAPERFAEIVASMIGEDRGVLEQYCVELVAEIKRLKGAP